MLRQNRNNRVSPPELKEGIPPRPRREPRFVRDNIDEIRSLVGTDVTTLIRPSELMRHLKELCQFMQPECYASYPELLKNDVKVFCVIREKVMEIGRQLLHIGFITFREQRVHTRLFHHCFYNFIELYRSFLNGEHALFFQDVCYELLMKGLAYFKDLLHMLVRWEQKDFISICRVNMQQFSTGKPDCDMILKQGVHEVTYNFLIILGDLYRYGKKFEFRSQLPLAVENYDRARMIDPESGTAYHRLFISSLFTGDRILMVWYGIRCGLAKYPADDVRQDLLSVFDNVYKEYKEDSKTYWYEKSRNLEITKGQRKEEWVFPVKGQPLKLPPHRSDPPTKLKHVRSLYTPELTKRFHISFVHFVGIIYTRIGMEGIAYVAENTLVYFEELLSRESFTVGRITHVLSLIMYVLDHQRKIVGSCTLETRRQLVFERMNTYQLGLEMFRLMLESASKIIRVFDWEHKFLPVLLTGIQLWCCWQSTQIELLTCRRYRPLFCLSKFERPKEVNAMDLTDDVWVAFAELMTLIEPIVCIFRKNFASAMENVPTTICNVVTTPLPECIALCGYSGLSKTPMMTLSAYTDNPYSVNGTRNYLRLRAIHWFGASIVVEIGILEKTPSLYKCNRYECVSTLKTPTAGVQLCGLDEKNYHYWIYDNDVKTVEPKKPFRFPGYVIKIKRNEQSPDPNMMSAPAPHMINYELWTKFGNMGYRTAIVIIPKRIMIDTNSFIHCLEHIIALRKCVSYPLLVPVSVILELRGLTKGGFRNRERKIFQRGDSPEARETLIDNQEIAQRCRDALSYINRNMHAFRFVNSSGTILRCRSVHEHLRDENYDAKITNDDRIVDSCKILEIKDVELRKTDTPRRIFRYTVLVTDDRILRIKANAVDIPTREIAAMVFWAYAATKSMEKTEPENGNLRSPSK